MLSQRKEYADYRVGGEKARRDKVAEINSALEKGREKEIGK